MLQAGPQTSGLWSWRRMLRGTATRRGQARHEKRAPSPGTPSGSCSACPRTNARAAGAGKIEDPGQDSLAMPGRRTCPRGTAREVPAGSAINGSPAVPTSGSGDGLHARERARKAPGGCPRSRNRPELLPGAPGQQGSGDGSRGRFSEVPGLRSKPAVPSLLQLAIEAAATERWSYVAKPGRTGVRRSARAGLRVRSLRLGHRQAEYRLRLR